MFCIAALRKHDVVFLVTVRPTHSGPVKYDRTKPFREQVLSQFASTLHVLCAMKIYAWMW